MPEDETPCPECGRKPSERKVYKAPSLDDIGKPLEAEGFCPKCTLIGPGWCD